MDQSTPPFDRERLEAIARAHYRAARWDEALGAIAELQAGGQGSRELDELINDIKLKQRLDAMQVPTLTRPARRGLALPLLGAGAALALVAALAVGLAPMLSAPAAAPAAALAGAVSGALPTPAPEPSPTAAPTAAPAAPRPGALTVGAEGEVGLGISNVYLILDASGSMLARAGERRKIAVAQEALVGLVQALPADASVALRTYGHRRPDDCGDVELLAQPGPLYRDGLIAQIQAIEPVNLSRTPIGASLEAAADDLAAVPGETLVVLVSDGEESCGGDPVAAAAALHGARPDVRVSVVGFDIAPELRARLAAIASAGGGSYADAGNLGELEAALTQVVTPRFRVLDAAGAEVGAGTLGASLELPGGAYTLVVGEAPALLEQPVEVRPGMATLVTIDGQAGAITAEVRRERQP